MRLDARAFGVAAGVTAAILFALCAATVAVAPTTTTAFAGYLIHVDLSGMSRTLTWGSFVGGLFTWTLGTGLTFALAGWLYNRLQAWRAPAQKPASVRAATNEYQNA